MPESFCKENISKYEAMESCVRGARLPSYASACVHPTEGIHAALKKVHREVSDEILVSPSASSDFSPNVCQGSNCQ